MNLWYIDEEQDDRLLYSRQLRKALQNKVEIEARPPTVSCSEMALEILEDPSVVAIVIDHRLSDYSDASYTGLQLAGELRKYNPKIPIYILTNHHDLTADEWEVEYVFSKDDFADEKKARAISERLQRHISIYFDISDGIQKRFQYLLKKSISGTLSSPELSELGLLDFYRTAPVLAEEAPLAAKMKADLDRQEDELRKLKADLDGAEGS